MSLIGPSLDSDSNLPEQGYTILGTLCTCDCHRVAGVYHVIGCCQPKFRLKPGDEVSIGDPFTGTTATIIREVNEEELKPQMLVASDLKITDHITHSDGSGSFKMTGTLVTKRARGETRFMTTIDDAGFFHTAEHKFRENGSRIYPYICGSPSKHRDCWLGYQTHEEALEHQRCMEVMLENYDEPDSKWNKDYWKTKPEPWVVILNPEYVK
jgi:hypothetical protein